MNYLASVFALFAIGASGFAISPKPEVERTKALPLLEPIAISIDDLALTVHDRKSFKESQIPKQVRRLHGKRVQLIGVMTPTFEETGIREFVFNGDTRRRFCNINAEISLIPVEYLIPVKMRVGTTTSYTPKSIQVEGRLIIRPHIVDGELESLYSIEDGTVRPGQRQNGFHLSTGIGC